MASTITYTDKVDLSETSVADINKVKASDLNEIKTVVNNNATDLEHLHGTTLYENSTGTNGAITLSDDYTNYDYIEIFGRNGTITGSCKFDTSLTSKSSIVLANRSGGTITIYTNVSTFSGTNLTQIGGSIAFTSSAIAGFTQNNEVYITKVVGYK